MEKPQKMERNGKIIKMENHRKRKELEKMENR